MRKPNELLHSRARIRPRYAVFPLEGYPFSRLPAWTKCQPQVLASPAIGAQFAEYLLTLETGGGTEQQADGAIETFFYVMSGGANLTIDQSSHRLREGGFALVPPQSNFSFEATTNSSVLMLRKRFEPAKGIAAPPPLVGHAADVPADVYMGDKGAKLQLLIPDDLTFDLAMNIFEFQPAHSLPYVETHVMEHGLYFLQGKGLYYLDGEWMEVEQNDFIWMGPYCPQSFYATGPVPSKYIYYKNVNREIPL